MMAEIERLLAEYHSWLQEKTLIKSVNDWFEITTPYIDRHNDYIQIYVKPYGKEKFVLSDDGYVINDLSLSGCLIDTPKRKELLHTVLNGLGVKLNGSQLNVSASASDFPLKKHSLIQAMLAVDDLFYTAKPHVLSLFLEDVTQWLKKNEVRFVQNVKFSGRSGYDHYFHFVIPESKERPERIVQALNVPDKNNVEVFLFAWSETKEVRPSESVAYAILNDREHDVSPSVVDALKKYEITPIPWVTRNSFSKDLAA
ncbi:DUF1829 domain-containing protein [Leptospira stimsonii]|uniref:DUF1829 domain-containing protein n=1 Tax=Leptospira stimsonii TaxID=2202203 RepID=A0A8B3CLX3_9LEPT|nr:DUF1829 domain-containing protein [Leptospira stimsonii]RHX83569.1 hypothetical protein DLM78_21500 [Leptospira stimsonii]